MILASTSHAHLLCVVRAVCNRQAILNAGSNEASVLCLVDRVLGG